MVRYLALYVRPGSHAALALAATSSSCGKAADVPEETSKSEACGVEFKIIITFLLDPGPVFELGTTFKTCGAL